jgi:peptide/nickel transport system substrate-binding protein
MTRSPASRSNPRGTVPLVAVAALAALVGSGCRGVGTSKDEIVLLIEVSVGRLDPRYAITEWEQKTSQLIAPGLMGLADRGEGPTPGLAESFEREDDLNYVARLRPNARFSDGQPVTSLDVKYTFDAIRDPQLGSPYRQVWTDSLDRVDVVDERTVRFRLKKARAPLVTDLEGTGIVSRRYVQETDEAVRAATRGGQRAPVLDPMREVIGAGPYKIVQRSADEVILERNPHALFTAVTPRLVIRTVRDDNARVLALVGGSADVILNGVPPMVVETLEKNPRLEVTTGHSATLTYLGFNLDHPVLRDRRVRQAIALGIDRRRLVAAKYLGRARLASSPLDATNRFVASDTRQWRYDPAEARRLLDQAGYRGNPRLTLTWKTSNKRDRVAAAQAMARQLADIGIAVEVRPFDFGTFLDDVKKGNFDLFTLQMVNVVEPDMLRALFHSDRIPSLATRWAGTNRFRYRNPAVDRWLDAGAAVADFQARKAIYQNVQKQLAEDLPLFPLWHEDNILLHRRQLSGAVALKTARLEGLLLARKLAVDKAGAVIKAN